MQTLRAPGAVSDALSRWQADAGALSFHLKGPTAATMVAIIGGTGTGKSTLVNRLIGAAVTAASFRRTYTAGPVAIARLASDVPGGWLGVERVVVPSDQIPVKGKEGALVVVAVDGISPWGREVVLVDTPDLDGDQPVHHAQADRVFRWAQAVVFAVTPEKYQMTELLPYYRLAARYGVPAVFVMNKCEESAVLEDYRAQLAMREWPGANVYAIPRDDAGYEAPAEWNLQRLRDAVAKLTPATGPAREAGIGNRVADLVGRAQDQVIAPLRSMRKEVDRVVAVLNAMQAPPPGVDVNPLTQQLQRRLQQRSVLYLMGPQRVLDRVRQVPGLIARLPRTAWDWVIKGEVKNPLDEDEFSERANRNVPDFSVTVKDQFRIVQSRVDDAVRSSSVAAAWVDADPDGYAKTGVSIDDAGRIVEEELADLKDWLEKRWNATPRDTAILNKLLKHLPGGQKLTQWSEAAPYLLAIVVATHGALFGHIDLLILGGWSLATWLTERLSNEVAARTRLTNQRIQDRFEKLAEEHIRRVGQWLSAQVAEKGEIDNVAKKVEALASG